MNRNKPPWQNVDYVYGLFSRQQRQARQLYRAFVEKGVAQGSRPDLVGGGLLRSSGGWKILKGLGKEGIRVKGDERILDDGDFVKQILESAEEALAMKRRRLIE
jgi:putative transposase